MKNPLNKRLGRELKTDFGKYFVIFSLITSISYLLSTLYNPNIITLKLIYNILISLIVPNVLMVIIFFKDENFKFFLKIIKKIFYKLKKIFERTS